LEISTRTDLVNDSLADYSDNDENENNESLMVYSSNESPADYSDDDENDYLMNNESLAVYSSNESPADYSDNEDTLMTDQVIIDSDSIGNLEGTANFFVNIL
jgi:hypothetical protein